ncbi:MAG: DUF4058 family protein [Roseiflexus sp.]
MPGPFPGMDPYLESRVLWPDVHQSLITYSRDALQPLLRPRYHARIGERLYVIPSRRTIYPDVTVVQRRLATISDEGGGTEVLTADAPVVLLVPPEEVREPFIEILDLSQGGQVVTVIEVLSPANKTPGEGYDLYRRKQEEVLASATNLVEIDLLRQGTPSLAIPVHYLNPYRPWHYVVSVSRAGQRERFEVYLRSVRERLPRVAIPLRAPDQDTVLDLQAVFARCYEQGAYADLIDYRIEPEVPLPPEDAAWADELLRRQGLRP